ncbi:MAG: 2-C-methyl-D-erythritol 4-phosphate cytidylyltransferase [Longicatena sp.]
MEYTALIVAAGCGSRMGLGYNKLLYVLKDGQSIIEKTLSIFQNDDRCKQIVVVISEQDEAMMKPIWTDKVTTVYGGNMRSDSVYNGLSAVTCDTVLIHDGARPWLSQASLDALLEKKETCSACLLMVPVKDTIKEVKDDVIVKTHERSTLMQAQTPQAFDTALLLACYRKCMAANKQVTDDAQVIEFCGKGPIHVVIGDYENQKITTPEDLR